MSHRSGTAHSVALPFLRESSRGSSYLASHLPSDARVYSTQMEDSRVKNEATEGKTKIQQVTEKNYEEEVDRISKC